MPNDPYFQPILESVRVGHIVHPGEDYQSAVHFDQMEGRDERWKHHIIVTDLHAIELVKAMLVEREQHINRIAELEDQVRSSEERARIEGAVGIPPLVAVSGVPGDCVVRELPAQDSGEALVGVECYVWGGYHGKEIKGPFVIDFYSSEDWAGTTPYRAKETQAWYAHARPVALGLPQ